MHDNTRALLLKLLTMLAQEGEERTFRYGRIALLGKRAEAAGCLGAPSGTRRPQTAVFAG